MVGMTGGNKGKGKDEEAQGKRQLIPGGKHCESKCCWELDGRVMWDKVGKSRESSTWSAYLRIWHFHNSASSSMLGEES